MTHAIAMVLVILLVGTNVLSQAGEARLRAGAHKVDFTPKTSDHLTFQVIGSRLKPGCAEGKIVATALKLMRLASE